MNLNQSAESARNPVELETANFLTRHDLDHDFIKPAYLDYCFSNIPGTIERLLAGKTERGVLPQSILNKIGPDVERVVLVFIDAFGWEAFERFREKSALFKKIETDGLVLKTTSQFPSTTAAHVTAIASGEPVYKTGICEWFYYEPILDRVINPFKLAPYDNLEKSCFENTSLSAQDIFPQDKFCYDLVHQEVETFTYSPNTIALTDYNVFFDHGAQVAAFPSLESGIDTLIKNLDYSKKQFHRLYVDYYDAARHEFGPYGKEPDTVALGIIKALERLEQINDGKTLLMITADHGHAPIYQNQMIYINLVAPKISEYLLQSKDGELICFGGSPRDLFLYTKPGAEEALISYLKPHLEGAADIMTQKAAHEMGILGPGDLGQKFADRMGNVLILPYAGYGVTWYDPERFKVHPYHQGVRGSHGGLTKLEMETPLLILHR